MSPVLQLELDRERYAPGEWVTGTVLVPQGGDSRSLEVFVHYYEQTRDYKEAALTGRTGPLHRGDLPAGLRLPFRIQLPPEAPPPYRYRSGHLFWEVDAKSDQAGFDSHATRRIVVAPPEVPDAAFVGEGAQAPSARWGGAASTPPAAAARSAPPSGTGAKPPGGGAQVPGWYPDPWRQKRLRYWDGRAWTGHTAD